MPRTGRVPVKKAKAKAKAKKPSRPARKAVTKAVTKVARKPAKVKRAPPLLRQPAATAALTGPYLGQIALLSYNFAPQGWAPCTGQIMPIPENLALFELIRTTYGGNGASMFMLPNLPPRSPSGPWYYIAIEGVVPPT